MPRFSEIRFEKINTDNQLSASVKCAVQDNDGFIWFGTAGGVCKFDGKRFKNYASIRNFSSRSHLGVTWCIKDSEGHLWFGTAQGSLLEYNYDDDCLIKHELNLSKDIPEKLFLVTSICEDHNGYLWVSVFGHGLHKFDRHTRKSHPVNYDRTYTAGYKDRIGGLSISEDNKLIVIMEHRIDLLDLETETFETLFQESNSSPELYCICKDNGGKYFIGSNPGIRVLDLKTKSVSEMKLPEVHGKTVVSITKDKQQNLWIGIFNEGIARINLSGMSMDLIPADFANSEKIFKRVHFFLIDNSDTMWVCAGDHGIYKADILTKGFSLFNNLNETVKDLSTVKDLAVDREKHLWIVSFFNYLIKYDKSRDVFQKYDLLDADGNIVVGELRSRNIFSDAQKNIWVGTPDQGLFRFDNEKDSIIKYEDLKEQGYVVINAISEYHDGRNHYLLLGTNKPGIKAVNLAGKETGEFNEFHKLEPKIANDRVSRMFFDSKKNLWVHLSDTGGVFKLSVQNSSSEHFPLFPDKQVLINSFHEDTLNNLWFCTSEGLFMLNGENKLIAYDERDGLPSNSVFSMVQDNRNSYWFISSNAVSRFNLSSGRFSNFDCKSRMAGDVLLGSCCIDGDGILYLGGLEGLYFFDPDEITLNTFIPKIIITDFQINNRSVIPSESNFLNENINHAKEINLSYRENIFSFEFAALVFNDPQKNQYAYRMDGFDSDWTYCGNRRRVTYTNLSAGEYLFRVKGSNNDRVWNEEGASVKIKITPPYWKTWWFRGLGLLSFAAATGMTYKNRINKIEKERKAQEEFSRKLIESQENERKRIASELHDTIAHDILITQNKAVMGLKHLEEKEKIENTLKEISELSSAAIRDVRNISYNLHPHKLEKLGFIKTVKAIANDANRSTGISFNFMTDMTESHLSKENEINLFRVIQESINNVIKHSGADTADIKLLEAKDHILLTINDNGIGIKLDKKKFLETKEGFGLSGMKERIKYMKGEIQIESEPYKGTSVSIRIPFP